MKLLLAVAGFAMLLSCSKPTAESTAADSTAIQPGSPATETSTTSPQETPVADASSSDETRSYDGNTGESDSNTFDPNTPMDFQPAADGEVYGDAPTAEEEAYAQAEAAATPQYSTSTAIVEQYYKWTQGNETVFYSLRFEEDMINGFRFALAYDKSYAPPAPREVVGRIDLSSGTFSFNVYETTASASSKITDIVEGTIENGNLVGTRDNDSRTNSKPFRAELVGPKPAEFSYNFMYKTINDVRNLYEIKLKGTKQNFQQTLKGDGPIEDPKMRLVTMDFNFDGNADFFLMCEQPNVCGGNFWMFDPDTNKYKYVAGMREIINPYVDFGNRRIMSINMDGNGMMNLASYAYDGQYVKESR